MTAVAGSEPRPAAAHRGLATAMVVAGVVLVGNLLGFVRDLLIAAIFGASAKTDAYLVGWMVPETTSTLLLEGAMIFVFVPMFTRALHQEGSVTGLVRRSMLPLLVALAACAGATALAAPLVVKIVAPGLPDARAAALCVRLSSATVFFMGTAGYCAAVLRAHDRFVVPSLIYVAYNAGIIATLLALHDRWGISSAAAGLAIGSGLMVAVQLPSFRRWSGAPRPGWKVDRELRRELRAFIPIGAFGLLLQSQVFVERFIGSFLRSGAISHLNYSMKTGQVPMTFVVAIAVVGFPAMARLARSPDRAPLRDALERDVSTSVTMIAPATIGLILFAPGIVRLLYQHGAFHRADTAATADLLRVYSVGLAAQVVQSIAQLPFFALSSRLWAPLRAAAIGLAVDAAIGASLVSWWGAPALAAGNAAGITVTSLLLLRDTHRSIVGLRPGRLARSAARVFALAAVAGAVAFAAVTALPGGTATTTATVAGLALVGTVYVGLGRMLHVAELDPVLDLLIASYDRLRRLLERGHGRDVGVRRAEAGASAGPHRPDDVGARAPGHERGDGASATPGAAPLSRPILMYHAVTTVASDPAGVCTSPDRFAAQMDWLARHRWRGVSVRDLLDAEERGSADRLVGLTFDDGFGDFRGVVVPVLEAMGFSATVYVCSDLLGGANVWDEEPRLPLMGPDDVADVHARGMEVGSHTARHRHLSELGDAERWDELHRSRAALGAILGTHVEGLAYPYGDADVGLPHLAREAGYRYAVTVKGGDRTNRWLLPRRFVGEDDNPLRLAVKLALGPR